jgi:hypothetical protein
MRRALHESLAFARSRRLFGRPALGQPLMRRQLLQVLIPAEQALSTSCYGGDLLRRAEQGSNSAHELLRIVTPVIKMRSNRDNVAATGKAIEIRGGNGVIEDWVNARLLRDSFIPVLWEGTSVINAIDVVRRAIAKEQADGALRADLRRLLGEADGLPEPYRDRLQTLADRAIDLARHVAADAAREKHARVATSALYNALSAILLAWEGCRFGARGGDARRLVMSRFVVEHRLDPQQPLARPVNDDWQDEAEILLLADGPIALDRACALVSDGRAA